MNTLLGLPTRRVERVNPLSIFYLMHLLVVLLGGASAGFTVGMLLFDTADDSSQAIRWGLTTAIGYLALFQATYYLTILRATSTTKLNDARH